ncbi:hypothetical protein CKO15_05025 [Halorhodospira abdelmalekii]|uniref:RDD family protein n=1 Tax=Halorhodospira abdelmalekii TaxID=421629 RepID=UPI001903E835|nr:RDD family protein [Halorhodospira abdelmalekii]MBK1734658.1 hypothetical protein [Halorhodospira abdelmalekii]
MTEEPSKQSIAESNRTTYGGFWVRVGAALIDLVVMLVPILLLSFLLLVVISPTTHEEQLIYDVVDSLLGFALWLVYTAGLHSSSWQATVGKRALGLKVTDLDGNRISFARATGRYLAEFLNLLTLGIGYIMVALTERKQGLHDKVASTYVVRTEEKGLF